MSDRNISTLAQMLFAGKPALNFAHVVRELDLALARYPATQRALTWDCDDLASFDLDGTRIVLSYAEDLPGAHPVCLTVAVGHNSIGADNEPLSARRAALCRKITDRLAGRYAIDALLLHETDQPVTSDLIDQLVEQLPEHDLAAPALSQGTDVDRLLNRMSAEMNAREAPLPMRYARPETDTELGTLDSVNAAEDLAAAIANDVPDLPRLSNPDLTRIRTALYAPLPDLPEAPPSTQMRLAVHALNATMVVVFAPVGLAAMAAGIFRGEDMRRSAQLMALTGLFLTLSQSPMGERMLAMI